MTEQPQSGSFPTAILVLLVVIGAVGGYIWSNRPADLDASDGQSAASGNEDTGTAKPALEGWEKPALALMISGEMHGYVEPCGCTGGQTGGLARRATLATQLRDERGWNVVGIDLGGAMICRPRRTHSVSDEV